ncbi:MAG: trypsin-like peptidase domain-containing protein [Anaerolineae bacterium]|nr:trypsin-like peptidase domain-containing protein [Anaerolineae bacterium]
MRRFVTFVLLCLLFVSVNEFVFPTSTPAHAQSNFDSNNIIRATVLLHQVYTNPQGEVIITCEGSGTLVSANGLILTNAHTALSSDRCRSDRIVISLTLRLGEAPVPTYYAEVVGANRGYDLAVLQIVSTLDNRPVNRNTLLLPFVELSESETVQLDDTVEIVGYTLPSSNGSGGTAEVVRGTITGFTSESRIGTRAWFKSKAIIPGSMTGGGAYDLDGRLIAIPTVEAASSDGTNIDCRRVQDSNGDGRVDQQDVCIPVGGFINAMRPSRLARGLILAARLGLQAETRTESAAGTGSGQPSFSRLFFSPGVNAAGMPTSVVGGMPAGTTELYLFFDYANMRDGMIYELRVSRDGVPDATFGLAPATWNGGATGLWYIGSSAQVWPNGVYEFSLFINGARSGDVAKITIGGPAPMTPAISDILFGVPTAEGSLASAGNVLPVASVINCEFIYNNMTADLQWRRVWYYEDIKLPEEPAEQWTDGANGKKAITVSAPPDQALQPGRYRLEIWLNERLAATSDFIMIGGQVVYNTEIFSNLNFSNGIDTINRVVGTTFPNTITALALSFNWRDVAAGTPWMWRWSVDDNALFEQTQTWQGAATGENMWVQLRARSTIPDGTYRVELIVGGVVRSTSTVRVGLGQLPVSVFGVAEGVQLQGEIVDSETGQGIPGVAVIVLKVEYNVADFTRDMGEVYAMSTTDSNGQFTFSRLLARGSTAQFYSLIILAEGYLPLSSDGLEVADDTVSPITLRLELNKD